MAPWSKEEGIVDYALSSSKSDFMDVYLCGACRFFIGTNSGLGLVPPIFGVPCAMTNWSPIGLPQWYPADMFIPKMIYSENRGRNLTAEEMLNTEAGWAQFQSYFDDNNMRVIDNSSDEILGIVIDMCERIEFGSKQNLDVIGEIKKFQKIAIDADSYLGAELAPSFIRNNPKFLN